MTAKVRVLVTHVPRLVRDVITHAIAMQPDMQLLDEPVPPGLRSAAAAGPPDVVIVGTRARNDLRLVTSTLWRWPRTQVLMVTIDGQHAALYRLEPQRTDLGELSPIELVEHIRSAARQRGPGVDAHRPDAENGRR